MTNGETITVIVWLGFSGKYRNGIVARTMVKGLSERDAADALKKFVEEENPFKGKRTFFSDLIDDSLQKVDWIAVGREFQKVF